ncbi:fungal zn(2)-Cys(6) binuclear cluster domain-containing protein [Rhizoctonia solani AG-1 IA]|uniref:Fungal zn(2)-Cys(6) binuclear cluster domain-containing protein n=1 Tax=Thanatephorus cucumeris (strain AG1-IA) TaxID=983506 RepID=L8X9U9_THACA|nr:fungal zn(2)-Cys(6) binuclear cluster domain-containing protein [Rhizoctonia solani AG-1 IA]
MPTPPHASFPQAQAQDGHGHTSQIHSHLQPGNTQAYYQHPHVLHKQPSPHLMPPPPLPLDPALVGSHQQLAHSSAQGSYPYPPGYTQPHQQQQQRGSQLQFQQAQQFAQLQEPDDGSDDDDDGGESDDEPVAGGNDGKGNKKRTKAGGGTAAKKHKQNTQAQDDDDDESGTPASGAGPKPKATRGSKACMNCRRLKMKCVGAGDDSSGKCDRCRSNNHECVFEESNRGKKPSKKQENLMRQLKRMEVTLDTLMHSISHPGINSLPAGTVTRSPTPSSPSVQALMGSPSVSTPDMTNTSTGSSLQKPLEKPRSSSPRLHMLPDNTLNPLGLLAEASLANRRDKGTSSGIGGMLPGNLNEDDGSGKVDGRPVGVASDAYFKPGPMNILPLRRLYIERQVQPEMLSFVSTEEVLELFEMLKVGYWSCVYVVPGLDKFSNTLLVCSIAAKFYSKKPELYLKLGAIAKKLAFSVPERGYKSVEVSQPGSQYASHNVMNKIRLGFFSALGFEWQPISTSTARANRSWMTLQKAGPGLGRFGIANALGWYATFSIVVSARRWVNRIRSKKRQWWKQPDSIEQDAGVVAYLEMQRILSRSLDFLYSGTQSASGLQTDCDYLLVIKTIESQFDSPHADRRQTNILSRNDTSPSADYRSLAATFYYHYAMLVINSFGLQNAMERSRVDIGHFFSRCHTSAMSCVLVVRDELAPRGYMRYSPDSHFVFTSYAVLTLLKLIRPEFSAFLDNEKKTLQIVNDVADVLEQIAANPYHTPALYSTFLRALIAAKKEAVTAPPSPKLLPAADGQEVDAEGHAQHHAGPTLSHNEPMGEIPFNGMRMYPPTGDGPLGPLEVPIHTDEAFPPSHHGHLDPENHNMDGLGMGQMFSDGFWDSMLMPGYGTQLGGLSGGFVIGMGGNSGFITPRVGSPGPFASGTGSPVRDANHMDGMNYPYAPVFHETT